MKIQHITLPMLFFKNSTQHLNFIRIIIILLSKKELHKEQEETRNHEEKDSQENQQILGILA